MDLELKEFEEKINNITEQFMSLLNSNEGIGDSVGDKFGETSINFEEKFDGPAIFNNVTSGTDTTATYSGISNSYNNIIGSTFKIGTDDINIGGIKYGTYNNSIDNVPGHAIRFDSVEQNELNARLENLYNIGKEKESTTYTGNPNIAFSDSNLRRAKSMNMNIGEYTPTSYPTSGYIQNTGNNSSSYTNDKTCSTLNDKEVNEMAKYGGENTGNPLYDFPAVPADKSLVESKDWKEVLFMDIPWDTKINLWDGFKRFCTAQIKITF